MAGSAAGHAEIQAMVEAASWVTLTTLRCQAEATLGGLSSLSSKQPLSPDELQEAHVAAEVMAVIEAREHSAGWLFRTKRRAQLMQMHFGS